MRCSRLPTPYVFAPINTGFAVNGVPTPELVAFHRLRSGKGIGISYVGNVAVDVDMRSNESTLAAPIEGDAWMALARAIAENGSIPGVQLASRVAHQVARKTWVASDPADWIERTAADFGRIEAAVFSRVVSLFRETARQAREAGFKAVQVHAAHGYFLSQSLSASINRRTDEYGADPTLLVRRVLESIRDVAPDLFLDVRVSVLEGGKNQDAEAAERFEALRRIVPLLDMVSCSNGLYELDRNLIYPSKRDGHACFLPTALKFSVHFTDVLWNFAGNVWDLSLLPPLPSNLTVGIGRALIADPWFVEKSVSGAGASVRACDWNGKCHYYTNGGDRLRCPVSEDLR